MNSILIKKKQAGGGLRVFSLVRGGSEVKCLRTTALADPFFFTFLCSFFLFVLSYVVLFLLSVFVLTL
jgi:hypothetical protein